MYLAPEGEELEIAGAAANFLSQEVPLARLHTPGSGDLTPAMRRSIGAMGWFGLTISEASGGSGLGAVEHALFFREAGRQCAPLDLVAQCLAASVAPQGELRGAILDGSCGVALIEPDGQGWRLVGLPDAEYGLLVTKERASLHELRTAEILPRSALDPANSLGCIACLPTALESLEGGSSWRLGSLAAAAMLVGIAEVALERTVDYAQVRETFGRKIGSWQAVRHPCADMAVCTEAARAQLWYAAAAIKARRGDADAHVDAAKHMANKAALTCTDTSIQLHGGIGVTDEHDCHLLLKHALLLTRVFGCRRSVLGRLLHARLED